MIEELVEKVFAARNEAHVAHWSTKSFAEHMALSEFYDSIIGLIDKLVEAYQGYYGLIKVKQLRTDLETDILTWLNKDVQWIEKNREAIVPRENTALHNIIDEAVGTYDKALYKLRFLK